MLSAARNLGPSLRSTLRELAGRPAILVGLLLFLNAIFIPYLGIIHDAQIYYGLVLNRIDPSLLSSDLFFQYGSQDQYSIFSPLMIPLVNLFGMKGAFFVGYVAGMSLFLAALVRLITRLWPDSPATIAGLVFLAIVQIGYGGYVPLHVLEPFFTARLPACALTIWALADLLDRRRIRCGLFLAAALAIHPLMTFPGLLVVAIVELARRWGRWGVIGASLAGAVGFGGVLAYRPLAIRLFGYFDSDWLALTQQTNSYQFPQEWFPEQWSWNLGGLTGLAAAAWWMRRDRADSSRVLAAAALVGAAGLFGSLLFTQLPYALLLKGQAYRWLWLPFALAPCALFDLAWNAWRTGELRYRILSAAILMGIQITHFAALEFTCLVMFAPIFFYGFTIFAKEWTLSDKISGTVLGSVLVGFAIWGGYRLWITVTLCVEICARMSAHHKMEVAFATLGPGVIFPLLLIAIAALGGRLVGRRQAAAFVAAGLGVHLGLYLWIASDSFRASEPQSEELRFVEEFLDGKLAELDRPMTVYTNLGKLEQCWVEWRVQSYYDCFQLAGFVFNKQTAVEGKRRALLVAPFEAVSLAKGCWGVIPDGCKNNIEGWLETSVEHGPAPQPSDLLRLAHEDAVDYIVLFEAHFDDLACARVGNASIYDCRRLREIRVAVR